MTYSHPSVLRPPPEELYAGELRALAEWDAERPPILRKFVGDASACWPTRRPRWRSTGP